MISGSAHPHKIEVAASTGELDHSGFVFDKHQMEFENLYFAKGLMTVILADFKRMIDFFEESQYKNNCPLLTGRQIMFQIFSFFDIHKTWEHTMNFSDLPNVELYNDPKMFNRAWEGTFLAPGDSMRPALEPSFYALATLEERRHTLEASWRHAQDEYVHAGSSASMRRRACSAA